MQSVLRADTDHAIRAVMTVQMETSSSICNSISALRETLTMMPDEEGMETIWARHAIIARAVWAAVAAWGGTGIMSLNVTDATRRAAGVTTINTAPGVGARIRRGCETEAGVTLGNPLGFPPDEAADHVRIGHVGRLNVHMIMGTLGAIETAMAGEKLDRGSGALAAAARTPAYRSVSR